MVDLDTFGIRQIYPTASGGRVYNSNWHTATSHEWNAAANQVYGVNLDPQDSMADLICADTNVARVDSGSKTLTADTNSDKNSWRMYFKDPAVTQTSSPWKWSESTEITVYYKAIKDYSGGSTHVHCRIMGPTEHYLQHDYCGSGGHEYGYEIKRNGVNQFRKEEVHVDGTAGGYAEDIIFPDTSAPYNQWIGMKLVTQLQAGKMKVEAWKDLTDGANGGTWIKAGEMVDDGTNWKLPSSEAIANYNSFGAGTGNCLKVTPMDCALTMDCSAVGLRVDNTKVQFKKFSVREIDPLDSGVGGGTGTGPPSNITPIDLGMFLTGGSTNTDTTLSRGGNVSSTEVISDIGNNVWRRITESEAGSGVTIYRCVAIKNKNAVSTFINPVFYMVFDTVSVDDLALYSYAQADKNTVETVTANEFTAPTGSKINFIATLSRSTGLLLPNLAPGDYINLWLRLSVNPGAKQFTANKVKFRLEVNGTGTSGGGGGTGGGGGGPLPPPDNTGVSFRMSASSDTGTGSNPTNILNKMKAKNADMIIYNGDLSYSSSMSGWLSMTSSVRSKSMVSFGNHDVDDGDGSQTTINALFNAYGISKTYYSKIFNNVGIVVMEAGENQSVSSSSSSAQYTFVKNALESFKNNSALEWIFVCNHYPIEGPRGAHHPNEDTVRDDYVPLFDANGVDVVITGHNHDLWRTKLLKYNSGSPNNPTVVQDGPDFSYNRATVNHGHIYFDVGAGGNSHYTLGTIPSYVPFANTNKYGYLFMEFSSDGKTITFKFYDDSDNLLDTSTLTHT